MSIVNLTTPNNFDLYSRSFNVKEFVAEALEALNLDITGELIADKIVNNIGFNYLSPWSANKSYILNDFVISNNQLWRCLVPNINVAPDPNNPAQAQWITLTSSNAILNDRKFVQINRVNGDDTKALSGAPFKTIPAALAYLATVGGGYCKITTTGQGNLYTEPFDVDGSQSNIVIDGGDETNAYQSIPENIVTGYVFIRNTTNTVIKNLTFTSQAGGGSLGELHNNKNLCFENVTLADPTIPGGTYFRLYSYPPGPGPTFGSHSFINCAVKPGSENVFSLIISGACDPNTIILFDNSGLPFYSVLGLDTLGFGGITTPENLTIIIKNCYLQGSNFGHVTGMNMLLQNCIIKGPLTSAATSGSLTLINCSFLDPATDTWGSLNLSGTAEYKLIDCLTNPKSATDVINVTGNVNSFNTTSGPAARFNRLATWSGGAPTSTGAAQAVVQVLPGNIATNVFSMLTYNSGTGAITFVTPGVYQLMVSLSVQNTATANEQCVLHCFFGVSGANEGSALALTSTDRGFVSSAGILATYPASRRGIPLLFQVTNIVTPYYFFVRNLSAVSYSVTIEAMSMLQIR